MRQSHEQNRDRKVQQPSAGHGRHQDGQRRNRRDLEAAQDVGLAVRHGAHPGAPQPVAQDPHGQDGADEVRHPGSRAGVKQLRESKEENEGKQVIEEQDGAVPQRQLHVAFKYGDVGSHSRRLFPVSSMKASSSDGRLMRISASSMPASSSHLTISTMVRAGRWDVTAMRVRDSSSVTFSASRQAGSGPAATGSEHSISMTEWVSVRSWISRGVPRAMIRPSSMMATRSQSFSASSM